MNKTRRSEYGNKFLIGQLRCTLRLPNGHLLDQSEKANFLRSKYIPGNGSYHKLGRGIKILGLT